MGFPEAYDGPKLAAWLRERGELRGEGKTVFGRTVTRWASGEDPTYITADKWLTSRGIHLDEIPDEFGVAMRQKAGRKQRPKHERLVRERGFRLIAEGWRNVDIARKLGVNPRTVGKWRKKMEARA